MISPLTLFLQVSQISDKFVAQYKTFLVTHQSCGGKGNAHQKQIKCTSKIFT